MSEQVVIRYPIDVPGSPEQPAHVAGETFVVTDAAAARAVHPEATIVRFADGRPWIDPEPARKPARAKDG